MSRREVINFSSRPTIFCTDTFAAIFVHDAEYAQKYINIRKCLTNIMSRIAEKMTFFISKKYKVKISASLAVGSACHCNEAENSASSICVEYY